MICIYSLVLILYSVCEEHDWVEQQCIAVSSRHPAEDITVEKLEEVEETGDMKRELKVLEWRGHQKPWRKWGYCRGEGCKRNKTQIRRRSQIMSFLMLTEQLVYVLNISQDQNCYEQVIDNNSKIT